MRRPRYTGRQVWNRQRKAEILINIDDVALGHETKMRWNPAREWIYSSAFVMSPLSTTTRSSRSRLSSLLEHAGRA